MPGATTGARHDALPQTGGQADHTFARRRETCRPARSPYPADRFFYQPDRISCQPDRFYGKADRFDKPAGQSVPGSSRKFALRHRTQEIPRRSRTLPRGISCMPFTASRSRLRLRRPQSRRRVRRRTSSAELSLADQEQVFLILVVLSRPLVAPLHRRHYILAVVNLTEIHQRPVTRNYFHQLRFRGPAS